jgi:hypothetical protein
MSNHIIFSYNVLGKRLLDLVDDGVRAHFLNHAYECLEQVLLLDNLRAGAVCFQLLHFLLRLAYGVLTILCGRILVDLLADVLEISSIFLACTFSAEFSL